MTKRWGLSSYRPSFSRGEHWQVLKFGEKGAEELAGGRPPPGARASEPAAGSPLLKESLGGRGMVANELGKLEACPTFYRSGSFNKASASNAEAS